MRLFERCGANSVNEKEIKKVWAMRWERTLTETEAGGTAQTMEIKPEKQDSETADWWHVLRVDTRYNTGYLINRMESKPDEDRLLEDGNE